MDNVFMPVRNHGNFSWDNLGDIKAGRSTLGEEMPVLVYRLMQFTMLDVMTKEFGREKANEFLRKSGHLAGSEFAKNALNLTLDFDKFVAELHKTLLDLKVGILRIESINPVTAEIILTVGEDLDCSGLPITNETVCDYDEGFIAGILDTYTGKTYTVREVDCWATGDRVCRFKCNACY